MKACLLLLILLSIAIKPAFSQHSHSHSTDHIEASSLDSLYQRYLSINEALSEDNFEKTHKRLESLLLSPIKFPLQLCAGVETKELISILKKANQAKNLNSLRLVFSDLSQLLSTAMKTVGYHGSQAANLYHCPMANRNKGADWIQGDGPIRNPYMGYEMLDCWKLKSNLKAESNPSYDQFPEPRLNEGEDGNSDPNNGSQKIHQH